MMEFVLVGDRCGGVDFLIGGGGGGGGGQVWRS